MKLVLVGIEFLREIAFHTISTVWKITVKREHDLYRKSNIFPSIQRFHCTKELTNKVNFTEISERDRVF